MAFEDDDDLNKWLQSQQAPSLAPQSQQAPAAGGGDTWARARDLMDKQAAMKFQPQDYSQYLGQKEAAPDRTGHDFRTILAMALDLFGNKGRGAGQLMQAGNQTFDQKEAAWKRENGPQAQLARQMQVKQLEGADRGAFNQDRAQLGAQIGQETQLAGAQQGQANADRTFAAGRDDHDDAAAQQQLQRQVQEEQFAAGQGLTREQMAQTKSLSERQMAQSAAQAAASRAQARELAEFQANEALNARQDQYAHADQSQERQFTHADETQQRALQTQKDIHDLTHPAPTPPPGYRVRDGQSAAFTQSAGQPSIFKSITDKAGNAKQIQESIGELERLRKEPSSEANKRLYDATIKTLIGDRSQEGSTGVLSGTEFERYVADLPEYGTMGNFSTWRGARDMMMGQDPAIETLQGFRERFKKSHLADMSPYGLEYDDGEQGDPLIQRYGLRAK